MISGLRPILGESPLSRVRSAIRTAIGKPANSVGTNSVGINRVVIVEDGPQVPAPLDKVIRWRQASPQMSGLGEAIESGAIRPFYQPIVDMRNGRVSGAEALVRWIHPEQGMMLSSDIIAEAEIQGLIPALSYHVLDQSLRDWTMLAGGDAHFGISVNVTADMVMRSDFMRKVIDLLAEHRVPPGCLTLDITESPSALDTPGMCSALCRLRAAGINLALDDVGAGHSTLGALRDLPFNKIKLDRSFVTHATERPEARMIMASVTRLASDFGLHSVAEGIETRGSSDLVRAFGMDYGQGYLMAEPMSCAVFCEQALLAA